MEFLKVLLPVFGIFALGYIGEKKIGFDTKNISAMTVYLLSPVLVFRTFYTTELNKDFLFMIFYAVILCFTLIGIVYAVAFFRGYSTEETCGMILSSVFMNNGNYGTPVILLLFGAAGFDYAIILMVIQSLIMCTVGVYYAAKGSPHGDGIRSALRAVRRMPMVYGAIAGAAIQYMPFSLGKTVEQSINLVADAAIPTVMILLGMQLAKIKLANMLPIKLSMSLTIKLAVSPFIAYLITLAIPVDEMVKQIMVICAAMPSAANTTMYAIQFDTEPEFVSGATLLSTLLSLITLPVVFFIVL